MVDTVSEIPFDSFKAKKPHSHPTLQHTGVECLSWEEYVGEEDGVDLREDVEGAAEGLENHPEEVPRVEADERDQQQVE